MCPIPADPPILPATAARRPPPPNHPKPSRPHTASPCRDLYYPAGRQPGDRSVTCLGRYLPSGLNGRARLNAQARGLVQGMYRVSECGDQATGTGDLHWSDQYGFTRSTFISPSTMLPSNPTSHSPRWFQHIKMAFIQQQQQMSLPGPSSTSTWLRTSEVADAKGCKAHVPEEGKL